MQNVLEQTRLTAEITFPVVLITPYMKAVCQEFLYLLRLCAQVSIVKRTS